jgi:serine/threonine protein kinase
MTALSPCPAPDRLRTLIDGAIAESERSELVRHLDDCEACQQALERLAAGESPFAATARQLAEASRSAGPEEPSILRRLVARLHAPGGDPTGEIRGESGSEAEAQPDAWLGFLGPPSRPGALGSLAQYEVLELIGQGGMGMVLKAFDPALNRLVAIKVMAPHLAAVAAARKRFAREARAAAAVSHEHVVPIYAVDEFQGLPYLVMPLIAGESLQDRLDRCGTLKLPEILRIGRQVAVGLAAAHAQGLIHRDIKPSNILLENGVERVKITDFGLARTVDDASLTHSDVVVGTPQYMAPEQARGEPLDPRSDLFSLGGVLYAMCLGRPPFRAPTALAVLKRVCEDPPRPIRDVDPEVPAWLAAIIEKLLAKDPAGRHGSAAEVAQVLEEHLARLQQPQVAGQVSNPAVPAPSPAPTPPSTRTRSPRWAIAAALLALAIAGLGWTQADEVNRLAAAVATILRIQTPGGVLVLQVDDPEVKVRVDDQAEEIVLSGAGVHEVRLRPGAHRLRALKEGKLVHEELLEITRGGKRVAKIGREVGGPAPAAEPVSRPVPPSPARARAQPPAGAGSRSNRAALRAEFDDLVAEYHRLMKGPLARDAETFRKLEDRMIEIRRRLAAVEAPSRPRTRPQAKPAPARGERSDTEDVDRPIPEGHDGTRGEPATRPAAPKSVAPF